MKSFHSVLLAIIFFILVEGFLILGVVLIFSSTDSDSNDTDKANIEPIWEGEKSFVVNYEASKFGLTPKQKIPQEEAANDQNIETVIKWKKQDSIPCSRIENVDPENTIRKIKKGKTQKQLEGLIYIKVPKTGSSTLSGINLRIAKHYLPPEFPSEKSAFCAATYNHNKAHLINVKDRIKDKTFLWTFIRQYTTQILSNYFHMEVSRKNKVPTFANIQKYLNKRYLGFTSWPQINFVSPSILSLDDINQASNKTVYNIITEYDFIGIQERFDESLVALRLLLGLEAGDILYLSSKLNGGYDDGRAGRKCHFIQKVNITQESKDYFQSQEWHDRNLLINKIYQAANASLDRTIEHVIGKDEFQRALAEHLKLKALSNQLCASRAIFPCSSTGKLQNKLSKANCYKSDNGCGYQCLDELFYNYSHGLLKDI